MATPPFDQFLSIFEAKLLDSFEAKFVELQVSGLFHYLENR